MELGTCKVNLCHWIDELRFLLSNGCSRCVTFEERWIRMYTNIYLKWLNTSTVVMGGNLDWGHLGGRQSKAKIIKYLLTFMGANQIQFQNNDEWHIMLMPPLAWWTIVDFYLTDFFPSFSHAFVWFYYFKPNQIGRGYFKHNLVWTLGPWLFTGELSGANLSVQAVFSVMC